jgi:hypothetical protein
MCILCDHETLDLLTAPLERFQPGQLAEVIRTARDAASPGVLDHAEAVLRGDAPPSVDPGLYGEIVIARALECGVLTSPDASVWGRRLEGSAALRDPRVQAFLSSCSEILDEYLMLGEERRQIVERFVEAHNGSVRFMWLGPDGELWFDFEGESYSALSEVEAVEIVQREIGGTLHSMNPELLLQYTSLPDTGLDVLAGIQSKPAEIADSILSGIIDLAALADDRIRSEGYGPFFKGDPPRQVEDLRFGEWVIVRVPAQL